MIEEDVKKFIKDNARLIDNYLSHYEHIVKDEFFTGD